MDENQFNKIIGFGIVLIIASCILQIIVPFVTWAVVILVVMRVFMVFNKHK